MITVSLSISEGPVTREINVRASSLARARRIAGEGRPGVSVALTGSFFPMPSREAATPAAIIPARAA